MATTSPTRVDDELYASAKAVGAVLSRSAAQQLAHWARVGRELEASASISARDVARVLAGAAGYDRLTAEEQALVRAAWDERLTARLAELDLAAELAADGVATVVEADGDGRVVERQLHAPSGR